MKTIFTKHVKIITLIAGLIVIVSSCSSTKMVRKPPDFKIQDSVLSKRIKLTKEYSTPLDIGTRYNITDPEIISHVKYINLSNVNYFRWEWYSPDGKLFWNTNNYPVRATKGKYIKQGTVWHKLLIKDTKAETLPGDWKVKIYVNDKLTATNTFLLVPRKADMDFGNYHALVIGNNKYKSLPSLKTAKTDGQAVAKKLSDDYGFHVETLTDVSREEIMLVLSKLRNTLTVDDNLLIYYAGHGWYDKQEGEGYWLPVDADHGNNINWISNSMITNAIKAIKAKHIMVVADSCYSGKLTRGVSNMRMRLKDLGYFFSISRKKARIVLSSGGLEPVEDSGGGDHSVFASAFLNVLSDNKGIIDGTTLFNKLRHIVVLNSDQIPEYSDIRKSGHEGGDFLFIRKQL